MWGDTVRVFIGIEFETEVKEYLHSIQSIIKPGTVKGEFTSLDNFHLTTKYIGHVTDEEIDMLEDIIDEVCEELNHFDIKINGLGSFEKKHSSIMWVGILRGKEYLSKLFQKIERKTVQAGFERETRRYRPHITLGKKIVFSKHSNTEYIPSYDEVLHIDKITLFESSRITGELTYTPIYSNYLKTEGL